MSIGTILLIVLILALVGAFPTGGYGVGTYGTSGIGIVLAIVVVLLLLKVI